MGKHDGERLRIAVLGYIIRGPLGGLAWHHLQYVLGLRRMGHDVAFIEDGGDDGWGCYDPTAQATTDDPATGLAWAGALFHRVGMGERWAYFDAPRGRWHGPMAAQATGFCGTADVVLNLSGINTIRAWAETAGSRVLVDTDPVFTQIRHLSDASSMDEARKHDVFLTFGENVGTTARIPADGLPWKPTRQPVVLDRWAVTESPSSLRYTTVMQWSSYPAREYEGTRYGMKSDSFEPFMDLPKRVPVELELALGSAGAPIERLRRHGWHVVDPSPPSRDAWAFQDYLRRSRAEFALAKQGYVISLSGWFSERSANYLASGRPVITQDTGFSRNIPTGLGLMAFTSVDQAAAAIEAVESDYARHARAAREIATEYFDSTTVLSDMLETIGRGERTSASLAPATSGGTGQ